MTKYRYKKRWFTKNSLKRTKVKLKKNKKTKKVKPKIKKEVKK